MKRKSIIGMLLMGMMMGMFSTSCQDMLSPSSERHSYEVAKDTLYSYWGILKSLQNIAERYVILNECRGDLVDASSFVSDTIDAIVNFGDVGKAEVWKDGACAYLRISDYYHVINSCNAYIAMCDTTLTTGTNKKYMLKEYSQVQAIRAWVYMQLLYAYGENRVPFYKEPMLTTDDINNFIADKNHKKVSAQILVDELGPDLEKMEPVEVNILLSDQTEDQRQYTYQGMLEYYNYGDVNSSNSHFVCHSSKCLFPVSIVLGDLYLLAGNYERAARHYYNYINTETCGPLPVDKFYSTGLRDDSSSDPLIYEYDSRNIPYTEKGAVSKSTEAITCIPSNKGKLEGRVLTDINRLFGFEAQLTTSASEEGSSSYVGLSRNYERELIPSAGYEALCNSQKYEIYEGNFNVSNPDWSKCQIRELPGVGDARRAWIYASRGKQWTFAVGDDILYGKMVTKQNPGGAFSTTYPVVYRRSTVWLRYAEALNRAGFPAYAFAILKTGLCSTDQDGNKWYPINPQDVFAQYQKEPKSLTADPQYDYPVKEDERIYCYCIGKDENNEEIYVPEDWIDGTQLHSIDELKTWMTDYYQQQFDDYNAEHPDEPMESPEALPDPFESDPKIRFAPANENAFGNIPLKSCNAACYYIPLRELQQASTSYFLNFRSSQTYLHGPNKNQTIYVKDEGKLLDGSRITKSYGGSSSGSAYYTMGVHQRGCGFILYNDPQNCRSSYNYVEQVGNKLREYDSNIKAIYTQYDSDGDQDAFLAALETYIYDDANLANVQKAVEDLIIDEMGLELAFEGTRFSDLCRVAMRRNDNNYLAERVAKRHGTVDPALQSRLQIRDNWFLPIPE